MRVSVENAPGLLLYDKKGNPRAALLVASYEWRNRRLRGLLESGDQRLKHLRILLVGRLVGLGVLVFGRVFLATPFAIERHALAAEVDDVERLILLALELQTVGTEIGDEHPRGPVRGAVQ